MTDLNASSPRRAGAQALRRCVRLLPALLALVPLALASAQTPHPAASAAAAAASAPASQEAKAAADIVATVNGMAITRQQILAVNPAAAADPAQFQQTVERFINTLLLYQVALRDKLEDLPAVKNAIEAQRQQVLVNAAEAAWWEKNPIAEADVKARYDQIIAALPKEEWRLRQIVVTDRTQAEQILTALKAGKRFTDLAAAHPESPNSALGGELGWVNPQQLPAPIEQAVAKLQPGEVTGPIVLPQGVAVVQLLGRRKTEPPPLAALTPQILFQLRNESLARYLQTLRSQAQIHLNTPAPK